jgi:hypothetical protein
MSPRQEETGEEQGLAPLEMAENTDMNRKREIDINAHTHDENTWMRLLERREIEENTGS